MGRIGTVKTVRRSRRWAIAFALGDDLQDVMPYQSGHGRVPIFSLARGPHGLAVALRGTEVLPDGYAWRFVEVVERHFRIYVA